MLDAVKTETTVKHTVLQPTAALRPFVKRFEFIESFAERIHVLVPGTSLVACFRLDGVAFLQGASALPGAIVSGLQDRARLLTHLAGSHVLLTVFTETGAAAFLRQPLDQLFNQTVDADCLLQRPQLHVMQEQLIGAASQRRRIEVVERFLLGALLSEARDPVANAVAAHIKKSHGAVRMTRLAEATGLSLSALERRFRKQVGTSPRKFASIVRMRAALRMRQAGGSLTEIAYQAGYCDQSHFIRDFKSFTGGTPHSFFRKPSSYC